MSIVTISRGSYGRGKAVAEKVVECLGSEVIGRDVVLEASQQFNNLFGYRLPPAVRSS